MKVRSAVARGGHGPSLRQSTESLKPEEFGLSDPSVEVRAEGKRGRSMVSTLVLCRQLLRAGPRIMV